VTVCPRPIVTYRIAIVFALLFWPLPGIAQLVTLLLAHLIVHNAHDPATMAAAFALAVVQDDADVEPGKRGNQRDTLAQ
jgi:hypothetical protein